MMLRTGPREWRTLLVESFSDLALQLRTAFDCERRLDERRSLMGISSALRRLRHFVPGSLRRRAGYSAQSMNERFAFSRGGDLWCEESK